EGLDTGDGDGGRGLADGVAALAGPGGLLSAPDDRGPTVGAETGIIRNGVTALRAVNARHRSARPPTARGRCSDIGWVVVFSAWLPETLTSQAIPLWQRRAHAPVFPDPAARAAPGRRDRFLSLPRVPGVAGTLDSKPYPAPDGAPRPLIRKGIRPTSAAPRRAGPRVPGGPGPADRSRSALGPLHHGRPGVEQPLRGVGVGALGPDVRDGLGGVRQDQRPAAVGLHHPHPVGGVHLAVAGGLQDRKSTRLNSSHVKISY